MPEIADETPGALRRLEARDRAAALAGRRSPPCPTASGSRSCSGTSRTAANPEIAAILGASVEAVESLLAPGAARPRRAARAAAGGTGLQRWLGRRRGPRHDAAIATDEAALEPFFAAARAESRSRATRAPLGDPRRRRRGQAAARPRPRRAAPARRRALPRADRRLARPRRARRLRRARLLARHRRRRDRSTAAPPGPAADRAPRAPPTRSAPSSTSPRWRAEHGRRTPPARRRWLTLGARRLARAEPRRRRADRRRAASRARRRRPDAGPALWHYARALPEPYRHDLGQALRASRGDWIGPREALRGQRRPLAAALTAEPFDPDAVAAVLTQQTQVTGDLSARGRRAAARPDRPDVAGRARRLCRGARSADRDRGPPRAAGPDRARRARRRLIAARLRPPGRSSPGCGPIPWTRRARCRRA